MGVKVYALREGNRYRVATSKTVFFGVFYDRETVDGEQYLLFIDESRTTDNTLATARIRVKSIREVSRAIDDEYL